MFFKPVLLLTPEPCARRPGARGTRLAYVLEGIVGVQTAVTEKLIEGGNMYNDGSKRIGTDERHNLFA